MTTTTVDPPPPDGLVDATSGAGPAARLRALDALRHDCFRQVEVVVAPLVPVGWIVVRSSDRAPHRGVTATGASPTSRGGPA